MVREKSKVILQLKTRPGNSDKLFQTEDARPTKPKVTAVDSSFLHNILFVQVWKGEFQKNEDHHIHHCNRPIYKIKIHFQEK